MNYKLKTVFGILEIVVGLVVAGVGVYLLLTIVECRPEATYCAPLQMYAVLLSLVPGCIILVAGLVSTQSMQPPFWAVQLTMLGLVLVYYAGLFLWLSGIFSA